MILKFFFKKRIEKWLSSPDRAQMAIKKMDFIGFQNAIRHVTPSSFL